MTSELDNFRRLMQRSVEVKRVLYGATYKCVVYVDKKTMFAVTDAPECAGLSRFHRIVRADKDGSNRVALVFEKAESLLPGAQYTVAADDPVMILEFSSTRVRDYAAAMLPQVFE